ncbi:hypothetical protein BU251_04230 [Candidatus Velamenicoccus archaeovorus]|uniref:Uncharacterized protein n=1 Tax=Velamenicoccus archaeovorus TaxID=1930593 RepID=A0A410P456_VELA1|nr:hypothetical protein [Candidatus Velamenicoccus archaeovorus]QAT16995.1 hypothetical protein BU251_04230 [Candidatus Velamenicoccus archaeovorus]
MSKKKLFFIVVAAFLAAWNILAQAQQDQVTITTYFPSPNGVFSYIRMSRGVASSTLGYAGGDGSFAWGGANSMGRLQGDQGSSIEIGRSSAAQPYVRFNKGAVTTRVQLYNDNRLYIYVWNNFSIFNLDRSLWKDIHLQKIYYFWGWQNGTIEKANLQYL